MTKFANHNLINNDIVEEREYQSYLANKALDESTLVVLPTGTGKTIVNLFVLAERLKNTSNTSLMLAPTKPLVEQHIESYKKLLDISEDEIVMFTGDIKPAKREEIWNKSPSVVISTPQVIENDIMSQRISLSSVSHLTFDECHRAKGDYAYVYIADKYIEQANNPLITGLSASPGDDREEILKICENINVTSIEVLSEDDKRVKPYIHETKIEKRFVEISAEVLEIRDLLQEVYKSRLVKLYEDDYVDSRSKTLSNYKLRNARKKIQKDMNAQKSSAYKAMSIWAEAMKLSTAISQLETQGIQSFLEYYERLESEVRTEDSSKAVQRLVSDMKIQKAVKKARQYDGTYAKYEVLKSELVNTVKLNDGKAIVFTKSRDTVESLVNYLEDTFEVQRLVGQTNKNNSKGMKQKEQRKAIEEFSNGSKEVLISTQVGEEGLDISEVSLVVFYEPAQNGIKQIQRQGRTGRSSSGRVIILIGKGTKDMGSYYKSKNIIDNLDSELESLQSIKNLQKEIDKELKNTQKTLFDSYEDTESDISFDTDNEKVKIIADSREMNSKVLKELDLDTEVELEIENNMEIGDYIVGYDCAVERKEIKDFCDTLTGDRSLFEQIGNMANEYKKSILLIEGNSQELYAQNIHPNAIRGAKSSLIIDYGISVTESMNQEDTAQILKHLAKREQKQSDKKVSSHGNKNTTNITQQQEYIVSSFKDVGPVSSENLLKHFGTIKNIMDAELDELQQVDNIGKETAKQIYSTIRVEYN